MRPHLLRKRHGKILCRGYWNWCKWPHILSISRRNRTTRPPSFRVCEWLHTKLGGIIHRKKGSIRYTCKKICSETCPWSACGAASDHVSETIKSPTLKLSKKQTNLLKIWRSEGLKEAIRYKPRLALLRVPMRMQGCRFSVDDVFVSVIVLVYRFNGRKIQ